MLRNVLRLRVTLSQHHRGFLSSTSPSFNKHMSPHRGSKKTAGRDKRGNRITSSVGEDEKEGNDEQAEGNDEQASTLDISGLSSSSETPSEEFRDPNAPVQIEVDEDGVPIEIFILGEGDSDPRKSARKPKSKKRKRTRRSSSFNQADFEGIISNEERKIIAKGDFSDGAKDFYEDEEGEEIEIAQEVLTTTTTTPTQPNIEPTKKVVDYPPMPVHPKPRDLRLPEDDFDLHNPWGDLDDLHVGMPSNARRRFQREKTELDYMVADANELKDMRKYSLEDEDELITYYREMEEKSASNAYNVPMLTRQELYDMHKSDPLKWTTLKLSREFGLKKKRVEAIIKLFDLRSTMDSSYVRHELEDLIIEMEMLCGTSFVTSSTNKRNPDVGYIHPEMDVHYDRNEVSRRFIQLNDLETRGEAKRILVEAHESSKREATGKPAPVVIAEHETKRGKKIRFTEL
jgi:hypothetical protein